MYRRPALALLCRRCAPSVSTRRSWRHLSTAGAGASLNVDPAEVRKFAALSSAWWCEDGGPFAGLHKMNDVRVPIIRRALLGSVGDAADLNSPAESTAADAVARSYRGPFHGKSIVDVGCGGGILSESLARLGAIVLGVDAARENILAAQHHAESGDLSNLQYECTTVEAVASSGASFDCVVASEVLEHVRDSGSFLDACVKLLKPGGVFVITTINRTAASFAGAILGAEYILRIVPAGTHEWAKFVTPAELRSELRARGISVVAEPGLFYNPVSEQWCVVHSQSVNYAMVGRKEFDRA